jgi:hypothetical protein
MIIDRSGFAESVVLDFVLNTKSPVEFDPPLSKAIEAPTLAVPAEVAKAIPGPTPLVLVSLCKTK